MDIDRVIEIVRNLKEEAPYDMPLGKNKKPPILARGCMQGARTRWKKGCK
jgi:hypothetical protein